MNRFFVFLACLTVFTTVGVSCAAQSEPSSPPEQWVAKHDAATHAEPSTKADKEKNASYNATVTVEQPKSLNGNSYGDEGKKEIETERAEGKMAFYTLLLVIVAGLQTIILAVASCAAIKNLRIINCQAKIMIRQTRITAKSAEAALMNARAVINAERAWISVISNRIEPLTFDIEIKNVGKTPAKFVSSFCEVSILERGNNLPSDPIYKTVSYEGLQPILFPPNDTRIIARRNVREPMKGQSPEQWVKSLINGIQEMYLWGCLRYTDSLAVGKDGKPIVYETRWGFKFMPPVQGVPPQFLSHPHLFPESYIDYREPSNNKTKD